ncbi:MAG: hypothetical protein Q8881_03985, partial [Sweet potato little leaf phytoplasma]|nr:hypothetical protein [Sweet potato little leaf phytoplasma]
PKRSNHARLIPHSGTSPTYRPTVRQICPQGRLPRNGRISAEFLTWGSFRRNGRINPDEFPPNFVLEDVFDKTAEFPPNFAVRDVSHETAESIPPNFALGTITMTRPNFRRISHSEFFPTK